MIKNIIFDLDGVLFDGCDFHADTFIKAINLVRPEIDIDVDKITLKHSFNIVDLSTM
jgi:phosphoglycolate phosphatase-like HAD superfamily hydrolase